MQGIKSFLNHLSHHPGVYQMLNAAGEVIYVGKAKDLKKRVSSYFNGKGKDLKTESLLKQIADIQVTVTHTENEAVILECNLIKQYKPRYNILLRDDKSYPYIYISHEHFYPRIDVYRGSRKKQGLYFGPYPSSLAVRETINLLQKLFKIRTCQDTYFNGRSRPCLLYQIGRCTGPCVQYVSKEEYSQQIHLAILFLQGKSNELIEELQGKMEEASLQLNYELASEYRDQIHRLRQIQDRQYANVGEANADVIGVAMKPGAVCIQLLTIRAGQVLGSKSYFPTVPSHSPIDEILSAFISQHYLSHSSHIESIPKQIIVDGALVDKSLLEQVLAGYAQHSVKIVSIVRGDRKKWLEIARNSAKQSLATHVFQKTNFQQRLLAFQQFLGLDVLPARIECYDISHTMGEATVGSCVVFDQAGPMKSDYRRFNIQGITPGDDPAAMRQVLTRRFKRMQQEQSKMPDVILLDGGATQLAMADRVLDELQIASPMMLGVAKGPDRKAGFETLYSLDQPPRNLPADSLALHFIQQIRDEAHRFAITGHRQRREKARRQSSLETIEGIGAKRRRDLLRYFGGIQGVAHASLDELMKVPGISRSLAERIFVAFHDATL